MTIHPDQIRAAEAVLRQYIADPAISASAAFLEALSAYEAAAPARTRRKKPENEPEGFAAAYDAYPRKVARKPAAEAYGQALTRATPEIILAGIKRYAAAMVGKEAKFVAHFSTWLNQDRWRDELNGPEGLVAKSAAPAGASIAEWVKRLEVFGGFIGNNRGAWNSSWGPKPTEDGCIVPPEARVRFRELHPRKTG